MFKIFKNVAVCVFLAAIMLTGCSDTDTYGNETVDEYKYFYRLGNSPIVYERDTKIMYYMIYNGYMSPYYNEHGQMCYYIDGQIIPIEEVLIDADRDCLAYGQGLHYFNSCSCGNSFGTDLV